MEATRDLARPPARRADRGARRGGGPGRAAGATATASRRATARSSTRTTAVFDLGRIEQALATDDLAMNLYRPIEAARTRSTSSSTSRATRCRCPTSCRCSSTWDFGWSSEIAVRDHPGRQRHLGVDPRLPDAHPGLCRRSTSARSRRSFHEAFARIWHGEMEDDGFNHWCLRRARLARGHDPARLLQVPAAGRASRSARTTWKQTLAAQPGDRPPAGRAVQGALRSRPPRAATTVRARRHRRRHRGSAWRTVANLDEDRILRRFLNVIQATLRTNYYQTATPTAGPRPYLSLKLDSERGRRAAAAAALARDLRLFAAGRGRAPARRQGRARRPALVGPARGFPHRDPGPGEGAAGQERGHRAGRRQGRLRGQAAAARGRRPRGGAGRRHRVLQDAASAACST